MSTALHDHPRTRTPGEATRSEFSALLNTCGVYELSSRAKIRLTGGDRGRWLNGMVTNNIRDLAVSHGVYCFLLNAQGHIQADLYAYNLGDSLVLDVAADLREKVLANFEKFIIMDDVEVSDVTSTMAAVGVAGPRAAAAIKNAGISFPELAPMELCTPGCDCDCGCVRCTLVRGDHAPGVNLGSNYELWSAQDQVQPTLDAMVKAGAVLISAETLEVMRIARGIPRVGVDIRERDLPQETGQERALSFTKGCYLGQEIVERIRSRGAVHRQFTQFFVDGTLPTPGAKIYAQEKEVGEITSGAVVPVSAVDRKVALGYLRREATGKPLTAAGVNLQVVNGPMV